MISKALKPLPDGRRFAIGDIHGRPDKLIELLKKIKFSKSDVLFTLGDYIDRGPNSKGVIDLIQSIQKSHRVQPILGNHEYMFLCAYFDPKYHKIWKEQYGKETLASFNVKNVRDISKKYVLWMTSLNKVVISGNFVLSHAGVNFQAKDTFVDTPDNRMNILFRDDVIPDRTGSYRMIVGHKTKTLQTCLESTRGPIVHVDAGCGKKASGKLIAYNLDSEEMFNV